MVRAQSQLEKAIRKLAGREKGWEKFLPPPAVGGRPGGVGVGVRARQEPRLHHDERDDVPEVHGSVVRERAVSFVRPVPTVRRFARR